MGLAWHAVRRWCWRAGEGGCRPSGRAWAAGAAVGACNALAITRIGLNPFIATLGSLSIVRGLTYGIVSGAAVTPPDDTPGHVFAALGTATLWLVPLPVLIMLVIGAALTGADESDAARPSASMPLEAMNRPPVCSA